MNLFFSPAWHKSIDTFIPNCLNIRFSSKYFGIYPDIYTWSRSRKGAWTGAGAEAGAGEGAGAGVLWFRLHNLKFQNIWFWDNYLDKPKIIITQRSSFSWRILLQIKLVRCTWWPSMSAELWLKWDWTWPYLGPRQPRWNTVIMVLGKY